MKFQTTKNSPNNQVNIHATWCGIKRKTIDKYRSKLHGEIIGCKEQSAPIIADESSWLLGTVDTAGRWGHITVDLP